MIIINTTLHMCTGLAVGHLLGQLWSMFMAYRLKRKGIIE